MPPQSKTETQPPSQPTEPHRGCCVGLDGSALKATHTPEGDFWEWSLLAEIITVTHSGQTVAVVPDG